jgi:hypothetical protein
VTKDEIASFTPASLANLESPPVFRFRPSTKRDGRAFERALIVEGLMLHDKDALRGAYVTALREAFDEEAAEAAAAQFRELWAKVDQDIEADPDEVAAAQGLLDRLARNDRALRTMMADNTRFMADAPKLAIGMLLVGWSGLPQPFRRSEGVVALEDIDEVQGALRKIEDAGIAANVEGVSAGLSFIELCNHALDLLNLSKDEEGKSQSPSPSPAIPNGSKMKKSPTVAGQ